MGFYYDSTEKILVEQYVQEQIGPIVSLIPETADFEMMIDLMLVAATASRPYQLLITRGAGAVTLKSPSFLAKQQINRVELVLAVSSDWSADHIWQWPIRLLHSLARKPLDEPDSMQDLHVFKLDDDLRRGSDYVGCIMHYCADCHLLEPYLELPRHDRVIFLEVIPLLAEEYDFVKQHSAEEFFRRVAEQLPKPADQPRMSLLSLESKLANEL